MESGLHDPSVVSPSQQGVSAGLDAVGDNEVPANALREYWEHHLACPCFDAPIHLSASRSARNAS